MQRVRCVELALLSLIQRLNGAQVEREDIWKTRMSTCGHNETSKCIWNIKRRTNDCVKSFRIPNVYQNSVIASFRYLVLHETCIFSCSWFYLFIYLLDVRATSGTEVDPLFGSADTGGF